MLDVVLLYTEAFTLILVRISSFLYVSPLFGGRNLPMQFKVGFMLMITLLITPILAASDAMTIYRGMDFAELFLVLLKEFMVGIALGLVASFIFAAVQVAGMFIDMQLGFAMANVFDPVSGHSTPITGQFKYALMLLLFLGMDGHHGLLTAVMQSYEFIPVGGFQISEGLLSVMMQTFSLMFLLGIKLAMPIVAALFLTDVGLAILSRAVPQMNVFVIGMPLKILVGAMMLIVVMPAFVYFLRGLFHSMYAQMDTLLRVLGG